MKNNLDIVKLYELLVNKKKIILKGTLLFFILAVFYVFKTENYYKSSISLYAAGELDDSSLLGQYGSIAENFGLSMMPSSNYYIPDIIDSRSLKKEIVLKKWNSSKFDTSINLIEYWNINKPTTLSKILASVKGIFVSSEFENKEISQINSAIEKLNELIHVDEQSSGLIVVSVYLEEPELASDIANYISHYLVDFIKNQQKIFADKSLDFIDERLNLAEEDLTKSEGELTEFRKNNPIVLDTPDIQLHRARLIRSVDVNQQVYITLREQLEIAKIESNKERLYINILDNAYPNPEKAKPKRFLLIIIITLCGLLLSITFQILKLNLNQIIKD